MPSCVIQRDNNGRISRVSAPGGGRSELFDRLAGIAAIGNVERAAKAMMTVYGDKFKERFGDWERVPIVRGAIESLRSVSSFNIEALRFRTSSELFDEYPTWLSGQTRDDGRHTTQISGTASTYEKIADFISKDSRGSGNVRVLDASSGLGVGTKAMRDKGLNVDDVEPYPSSDRDAPTYTRYEDIDGKYDYIVSNAVLNVIPDDWRADVLKSMADKLAVGGKLFINVRNARSVSDQKNKIELDSPSEILVTDNRGNIRAYQKGFTRQELKDYVEGQLGKGFSVELANPSNSGLSTGTAAVVVTRLNDGPLRFRFIGERGAEDKVIVSTIDVIDAATRTGDNLGVKINIVSRAIIDEVVEDPSVKASMMGSKGWYDPSSDEVFVVVDNHHDPADAERTVLHEVIAHKGLRGLLGDSFNDTMRKIYDSMDPSVREGYMARYGDEVTAAEEWLATLSENDPGETLMQRIVAIIRDALRAIGVDLAMNDADIADLLRRSKENLSAMDNELSSLNGAVSDGSGLTYRTGEPKLFFRSGDGHVFNNIGDAARDSSAGKVEAGFLSGSSEIADTPSGNADVTLSGSRAYVKDNDSFIPVVSVDTRADLSTRGGTVNYLVRKGLLSGERENVNGEYCLTGEGRTPGQRIFNAINANYFLKSRFGDRASEINDVGSISFDTDRADNMITLRRRDGREETVTRESLMAALRRGDYAYLDSRYDLFEDVMVRLVLEDGRVNEESSGKAIMESAKEEDLKLRTRLLDILSSLGVRVMGMREYLDSYAVRNGVEPSARALSSLADKVIALAEGATIEDLAEEVSHFLVDTYKNQEEVNEVLPSVRESEEWDMYASTYYEAYGKRYSGEELDRMVEREILGKILSRRFTSGMESRVEELEASDDVQLSLLGRIIRAIRNFFSTQRKDYNEVLDRIERSALADDPSAFDTALLNGNDHVMYSLEDKDLANQLLRHKRTLERLMRALRTLKFGNTASLRGTIANLEKVDNEINKVGKEIDEQSLKIALRSIIATAKGQVEFLRSVTLESMRRGEELGYENEQVLDSVMANVVPLVRSLRGYIRDKSLINIDQGALVREMDEILSRAEQAVSDAKAIRTGHDEDFWNRLLTKMNVPEVYRQRIIEEADNIKKDISYMSRFFGTLEHSSNVILRALGRVLAVARQRGREAALKAISPMTNLAMERKWGMRDNEGLIQTLDGKNPSSYLESARNQALYDLNMRREQANSMIDILDLEKAVYKEGKNKGKRLVDMSREDMVKAIMSDDGLMVPVEEVDHFDENKEPVMRLVERRVKATGEAFNPRYLTLDQQDAYHRRMDKWFEENRERAMKDEWYRMMDDLEKEVEKRLERPMERQTRDIIARIRNDRNAILRKFRGEDGKVDYAALMADPVARRNLSDMSRDKSVAKSEYYSDGKLKEGTDLKVAQDLKAYDEVYQEMFVKKDKRGKVSAELVSLLREIAMRDGEEAAYRFLLDNGNVNAASSLFEGDSYDERIRNAIDNANVSGDEKVKNQIASMVSEIESIKIKTREILRNYRDYTHFGETDFDSLDGSMSMNELNRLYDRLSALRRSMRSVASRLGVKDFPEYVGMESVLSDSFQRTMEMESERDGITELEFMKRYIPPSRLNEVNDLEMRIRYARRKEDLTRDEWAMIQSFKGLDGKPVITVDMVINGKLSDNIISNIMKGYAASRTYPYVRRTFPAGYSNLLSAIHQDKVHVWEMVMDSANGISREESERKYGVDINSLEIRVNDQWVEMDNEASMMNENYDPSLGYGYHLPRMDKYRNDAFFKKYGLSDERGEATTNKEAWEMRKRLLDISRGALEAYDESSRSVYLLPQISRGDVERLSALGNRGGVQDVAKNVIRDITGERLDDPIHGQVADMGAVEGDEDIYRVIPKYYINRLENAGDVSHDLVYSYSMYAMQAAMYREKRAAMSEVQGLRNRMLETEYDNGKSPETTHAYKMFKDWVNAVMYDVRVNNRSLEWNVGNHKVNVNKLALFYTKMVSRLNLGFSPAVALTGAITGQANYLLEGIVGQYIPKGSMTYGYSEAMREMPGYVQEIGNLNRTNKLYAIGEAMGVFNVRNRVRSAGYNKIWRTLGRDLPFKMLEVLGSPLDPQIICAVMDDMRAYERKGDDGRTRTEFVQYSTYRAYRKQEGYSDNEIARDWERLRDRSLWNSVEIRDGEVVPVDSRLSEEVKTAMTDASLRARSLSQIANGSLNEENRVGASRNAFFNMILPHRGWFIIAAQRAFKKGGFNFQTMRFEEGYDRTLVNLLMDAYKVTREGDIGNIVTALRQEYNKLSPDEQVNIRRAVINMAMFLMMGVIGRALSGYRDDRDDDWIAQFASYIGFRVINEMASQTSPFLEMNLVDMMQEPFVTARKTAELVKFWEWDPFETVESGVFKGESKFWRQLMKLSYGKQWYNFKTARDVKQTSDYWKLKNPMTVTVFLGKNNDEDED